MCGVARKIIAVLALKGCFRIWDVSPTAISGMYGVRSMVYVLLHIYVYSNTYCVSILLYLLLYNRRNYVGG